MPIFHHCCSSPLINHSTNLSLWLKVWTNWVRIYFESSIYWETKNITMMRAKTTTDNGETLWFGSIPEPNKLWKSKIYFCSYFQDSVTSSGSKSEQKSVSKPGKKLVDPSQNPSSSCPQLTIEEPTSTTSSNEEDDSRDQVKTSIQSVAVNAYPCQGTPCLLFYYKNHLKDCRSVCRCGRQNFRSTLVNLSPFLNPANYRMWL